MKIKVKDTIQLKNGKELIYIFCIHIKADDKILVKQIWRNEESELEFEIVSPMLGSFDYVNNTMDFKVLISPQTSIKNFIGKEFGLKV